MPQPRGPRLTQAWSTSCLEEPDPQEKDPSLASGTARANPTGYLSPWAAVTATSHTFSFSASKIQELGEHMTRSPWALGTRARVVL